MKTKSHTNGAIKIERGIPMPKSGSGAKPFWPFGAMKVGESFLVADTKRAQSARVCAIHYSKRNPKMRFATRSQDGGVRIWRTA